MTPSIASYSEYINELRERVSADEVTVMKAHKEGDTLDDPEFQKSQFPIGFAKKGLMQGCRSLKFKLSFKD